MTDREAVDFLKKAIIYFGGRRTNSKLVTNAIYTEAMAKAINALEEKTIALPIPMNRSHGEWEIDSEYGRIYHLFCSECKKDVEDYISGSENWWLNSVPNYCPNCGADMRKEGEAE